MNLTKQENRQRLERHPWTTQNDPEIGGLVRTYVLTLQCSENQKVVSIVISTNKYTFKALNVSSIPAGNTVLKGAASLIQEIFGLHSGGLE